MHAWNRYNNLVATIDPIRESMIRIVIFRRARELETRWQERRSGGASGGGRSHAHRGHGVSTPYRERWRAG